MATLGFSERMYLQYLRTKFKTLGMVSPPVAGKLAFDLFCTPYPKYKKRKAPAIFNHAVQKTVVLPDQSKIFGFEWLPTDANGQTVAPTTSYQYDALGDLTKETARRIPFLGGPAYRKVLGERAFTVVRNQWTIGGY